MPRRRYRPPRTTPCRDCGRQIVLCINPKTGKHLPIDPDPVPNGSIVLDAEKYSAGVTPCARVLIGEERVELDRLNNPRKRYQHHAATCGDINPPADYVPELPIHPVSYVSRDYWGDVLSEEEVDGFMSAQGLLGPEEFQLPAKEVFRT